MPDFTLDVQRGAMPGQPGAKRSPESLTGMSSFLDALSNPGSTPYGAGVFHEKFTVL
jgi:hypothetical protein